MSGRSRSYRGQSFKGAAPIVLRRTSEVRASREEINGGGSRSSAASLLLPSLPPPVRQSLIIIHIWIIVSIKLLFTELNCPSFLITPRRMRDLLPFSLHSSILFAMCTNNGVGKRIRQSLLAQATKFARVMRFPNAVGVNYIWKRGFAEACGVKGLTTKLEARINQKLSPHIYFESYVAFRVFKYKNVRVTIFFY